MLKVLEGLGKG